MTQYFDWLIFKDLYLEDSYVLKIIEESHKIEFFIETVLLETHPLYEVPPEGTQFCYRNGMIKFENVSTVIWIEKTLNPIYDATDVVVYGNIDAFYEETSEYHVIGEWGNVVIKSNPVIFELLD